MRLVETRIERADGLVRLVGTVERSGSTVELYFAFPEEFAPFLVDSPDPFLPALIVPSVKTGEPLEIMPPVSPLLLSRMGLVQDIYCSWFPDFAGTTLSARPRTDPVPPRAAAVGALFSGGVDSFFTLLRRNRGELRPRVTHLLFMKGLEQPLSNSTGTEAVEQAQREVARETGTVLIHGESNLRSHFTLNYELYYHGAALAAAGLALGQGLGTLLVPSSHSFGQLIPWGSHPLLDPLWSTERIEVVHDGTEARRTEKVATLAGFPLALGQLRVCLNNASGLSNCGRCKKCVRTMIALAFVGALPQARLFPPRLPADVDSVLASDRELHRADLLDFARRTDRRPDLRNLLERVTRRRRRRDALRTLLENTPILSAALPWIQRLRSFLRPGGRSQ